MPIYEYRCNACGSTFERVTSFGDTTTATCPNGHSNTRRVFSPPGIVFRGSGFYVTDNRSNDTSNGSSD
jgi:putative FmdB family regulatory protein